MLEKVVFLSGGTAEAGLRGLPATSRCREERVFRERKKSSLKKKSPAFSVSPLRIVRSRAEPPYYSFLNFSKVVMSGSMID